MTFDHVPKIVFRRIVLFLLVCFEFGGAASPLVSEIFTEQELSYISEHPVIRVSNAMDYMPFDFVVGNEPRGYSVEMVKMIADYVGLSVQFVNGYTWSELLERFRKGELDLMHAVNKTRERKAFGLFSDPYCVHYTDVFINGDGTTISSIKQLYGRRLAVGRDWAIQGHLEKNHPQVEVVPMEDSEVMLAALVNKKVDAVINNRMMAEYLIRKHNYSTLKIAGVVKESPQFDIQNLYFMGQKDQPELISIFNKIFRRLPAGVLERLNNKWLGADAHPLQSIHKVMLNYEERQYLNQKGVLRYAVDPDAAPYETINSEGLHAGISADYLTLFAERLGVEFELYKTVNRTESQTALKNVACDLMPMVKTAGGKSGQLFDFTTSYINSPAVVVTGINHVVKRPFDQLVDQTFVCMEEFATSTALRAKYPGLTVLRVNSVEEGLRRVKMGEAFGYIDLSTAAVYAMRLGNITGLKVSYEIPGIGGRMLASRKDEPLLGQILQKAVDSLTEEDHRRINNKWLKVTVNKPKSGALVWQLTIVGLLLLGTLVYCKRRLKLSSVELEAALNAEQDAVTRYLSLIDMVTGEYQAPLSVVDSCLDVVEQTRCFAKLPALKKQVNRIRERSREWLKIFDASLRRWDAGEESAVKRELVQLEQVAASAASLVRCAYPEHLITLDAENCSCPLSADRAWIMTAVCNILDNACKYSAPGSLVMVKVHRQPGAYIVAVNDRGEGMAEADIKSVLETNYQSPKLGDRRGIGLLVVKRIIDIYHGTLTVESTPGHGTLFQIEFPE